MATWSSFVDEARIAAQSLLDYASGTLNPTVRLGVTGLSRAGKTVFITALVRALTDGARLPVFRAHAEGRIARGTLSPQPDDTVPRFEIEGHLEDLVMHRQWPNSTRQISELRLTLEFQSERRFASTRSTLTLDIVDYPGEWILDLPLLDKSYEAWCADAMAQSRGGSRMELAGPWHAHLKTIDPGAPAEEGTAREAARLFTDYLRAGRQERFSLSTLPPGRFLMPGDLDGSPALTFAPLDLSPGEAAKAGSLHAMMARRFEAYKARVIRPFFLDHFARLDRQIVLVDVLAALNAGPEALADLENALHSVLSAFRIGQNGLLTALFRPRIDRILFAATKADHLHHTSHDRLEAILQRLADRAIARGAATGATVDVVALASVRATREASVRQRGKELACIVGTPLAGESHGREVFDGKAEIAVFPGDLPEDPATIFRDGFSGLEASSSGPDYRFLRFRPPAVDAGAVLPHIRLDRALEFLLGDRLA